jgi:hypothetical protein
MARYEVTAEDPGATGGVAIVELVGFVGTERGGAKPYGSRRVRAAW